MRTIMRVAVGAVAAVLVNGLAIAQNLEEVTVQATRLLHTKPAGRTAAGVPLVDVSLTYGVSVAGLDLATNAGALALERRVKDAAQQACRQVSRQYPIGTPTEAECAKTAAENAMVKVHELVAAHKSAAR